MINMINLFMVECMNLHQCILHGEVYGKRSQRQILRAILRSKRRKYKETLVRSVKGDVFYDGNIYLKNYQQWFAGCYHNNVPHFTKTNIPRVHSLGGKKWRIKDTIIYQTPTSELNDTIGLEIGCYGESLFILTSSSYLIRYKIYQDSFVEAENIYLGSKYNFAHLNYDRIFDRLILKSIHFNEGCPIHFYFAIFSAAPLKFIGIFPIRKAHFDGINNVFIMNGILTTFSVQKHYTLYDMDYIIGHFTSKRYNIGEQLSVQEALHAFNTNYSTATIGCFPYGLPINIDLKTESPHNYEMYSCAAENISFGAFPWHCLATQKEHRGPSCIYNFTNGNLVARIIDDVSMTNDIIERCPYFHGNSGRIMKINHDNVVCYKIRDCDPKNPDDNLDVCFKISFSPIPTAQSNPYSRFGRKIKECHRNGYVSLKSEVIYAVDCDEELDVLAILFTDVTGTSEHTKGAAADDTYKVGLYDNQSGEAIRVININKKVSKLDDDEWTIYFNELLLICVLKCIAHKGRTFCHMYQLK